jgi:hypothetical protein
MVRTGTGSEELAQKIARELAAWCPIIKKLNIALD